MAVQDLGQAQTGQGDWQGTIRKIRRLAGPCKQSPGSFARGHIPAVHPHWNRQLGVCQSELMQKEVLRATAGRMVAAQRCWGRSQRDGFRPGPWEIRGGLPRGEAGVPESHLQEVEAGVPVGGHGSSKGGEAGEPGEFRGSEVAGQGREMLPKASCTNVC